MHTKLLALLAVGVLAAGCCDDDDALGVHGGAANNAGQPVATNGRYSLLGNGILETTAANGLLANATLNGSIILTVSNTSTLGGLLSVSPDGSFHYESPLNPADADDTFTYTLHNAVGNSTATVTIALKGRGLFVNNLADPPGLGSQAHPFQTLAQAVAAADGRADAEIVVFRGDGTTNLYAVAVPLQGNQKLRGLDPAQPPSLTGPVSLTNSNRVADLQLQGPPVNATGASNATLERVRFLNTTGNAVSLVNATGTFLFSACDVMGTNADGFSDTASQGDLQLSVSNCSFANVTGSAVRSVVSGTGNRSMSVTGSSFQNGTSADMAFNPSGTTRLSLSVLNNTIRGGALSPRGLDLFTLGDANVTAVVAGNNVTNCTNEGMSGLIAGNSRARIRWQGNRWLGNGLNNGFRLTSTGTANLGTVFLNNTSDVYSLLGGAGSTFNLERLDTFANENIGNLTILGAVVNATPGSTGLP